MAFDPATFNPFDQENIKKDEALQKRLLQPKRIFREKGAALPVTKVKDSSVKTGSSDKKK